MKTSELTGAALDWAVAKCEGHAVNVGFRNLTYTPKGKRTLYKYMPSTKWAQGGPIIEREKIDVNSKINAGDDIDEWRAVKGIGAKTKARYGPTPLIAAMRCYVASKLGDEIDVPEELL